MPSPDLDDARFTSIDWDDEAGSRFRPDSRTVGFVLLLAVLAALLAYDLLVNPGELITELNWDPTRMDWLTLVSLAILGRYVLVPGLLDSRRTIRFARAFLSRPAGFLSATTLGLLAIFAIVGPAVLDTGYPRLSHRLQPPLFGTFPADALSFVYECTGHVAGGACHGSMQYPLGTTRWGEDITLLLAQGVQVALILGLAAGTIMAVLATAVGTIAGYYGGWVDDILMRYVEVQQTVPAVVVFVVLATLFLGNLTGITQGGLFALALVFGLLDWGGIARLVRSEVLTRRSAGYIRAARAAGGSDRHIIRRHVIPNSRATIVTAVTRRIPLLILAQTALAYLELHRAGEQSLGRLLRVGLEGFHVAWYQKWWITTMAVLTLVLLVVAFSVLGDVARDLLDPQTEVE